jgi:hypothetical protein
MGRKVQLHKQWMRTDSGEWKELTTAKFTGDATARNKQRFDYAGGLAGDQGFYMQNGGFFSPSVAIDQDFTRPATGQVPDINFETLPKIN